MTTGQHQGKLVLQAPQSSQVPEFPIADARPFLDPDATYLVTGGLLAASGYDSCHTWRLRAPGISP